MLSTAHYCQPLSFFTCANLWYFAFHSLNKFRWKTNISSVYIDANIAYYLQSITGVEIGSWNKHERLFNSLCRNISNDHSNVNDEEVNVSKAFYVALPDQHHSYFVTENDDVSMKCASISSIPFRWALDSKIHIKLQVLSWSLTFTCKDVILIL